MQTFTDADHDWFITVQELPEKYRIVIDNDSVWVETMNDEPECVHTFTHYGYEFIYAMLRDMGINAEFC